MPMVQITMLAGRTADQKRKLAKRITDALVEEAGARREAIIVAFHEVSKESYASGGELMVDKTPNSYSFERLASTAVTPLLTSKRIYFARK